MFFLQFILVFELLICGTVFNVFDIFHGLYHIMLQLAFYIMYYLFIQ